MRKFSLIIISFFCAIIATAQTGIGTTSPNASAKLDVSATNKGFLPPRVSLIDAYDQTTITSPATGLLVYCKGDAGLAAGYYFWNGGAWATIATAGGSGSVVAEFGTQILSANVLINSATPIDVLSFTLPSAGTWEIITFLRAQGTAGYAGEFGIYDPSGILVPNSEILAAYGEVASTGTGVIRVTTTGSATYKLKAWSSSGSAYSFYATSELNGRTGVTWKKISGNAAVTGQMVDYGIARYSGSDGGSLSNLALVGFDAIAAGNLNWSGNKFTLKANKTYELESSLAIYLSSSPAGVAGRFQIYDYTNNVVLANGLFMSQNGSGSGSQSANSPMKGIVTPSTDIQVGIRLLDYYGAYGPGIVGSTSATGSQSANNASYFMVKQIGSSAIVNPWTLNGADSYNTLGKVGIGTNAPAQALDVTGNVNVTGKINLTDPSGNVAVKAAGFVNAGVAVTLGDIQVQMSTGGSRSLQIKTTGANFTGVVSAYTTYSYSAYTYFSDVQQAINGNYAYLGASWGFATDGDVANYFVKDVVNQRFWRITLMVGNVTAYTNNFISIERML